jgi:tetratricopeptide (TPR) repeat protein
VLLGLLHPEGYSLRSVALTMPRVLWFYAYHLVWPFGLSVFYDSWFVSHLGMWDFYLPLAGVLAFSIALVWVAKKSRAAAFSAMWMLALLSPALVAIYVFIPDELVHDRYLYLPSVGFSLIAAIVIRKLKGEGEIFGGPRYQLLAVLALAGILAAGTAAQTVYWTNDLVLFAHGMGVAPRNVLAINHLANEMFKRNRPREALALYDRALQINPGLWQTHFAKGVTLFELADYRQANQQMEEAAKIAPENAEQFYFMGLSQLQMGDFRVAEEDLRRARALNPRRPGTHLALAIALEKQGRVAEAKEALRDEMRIYPSKEAAAELKKLGAE